jgi:hypothetical protein
MNTKLKVTLLAAGTAALGVIAQAYGLPSEIAATILSALFNLF